MVSIVKSRLNHYDMLALSPRATSAEITEAFAREIKTLRRQPFGATADVCVAYATLRDPVKRRAYDASIGLPADPEPPAPTLTSIQLAYRRNWKPAAFMAASLPGTETAERHPSSPPPARPTARQARGAARGIDASPSIKEQVEQLLALRGSDADERCERVEWARPGLTIAALLLAAAAIGAFAGLESVESIDAEQPARAATVGGSPAKTQAAAVKEPPRVETARSKIDPEPKASAARRSAAGQPEAKAELLEPTSVESIAETIQVVPSASDEAVAADEPASEPIVMAALPLANRDIARTIERIGYACGTVESTAPAEGGGAGVFKVNCSSGDVYRAAPKRGRYHFRRWGRR